MSTLEQLRAGELNGATRLQIACGLTEFPPEIFELADTLEILDLSGNALSSLPDDLSQLHKLRIIFCSDNQFTELPAVLGECASLSMVGFKANFIRTVPPQALPEQLRWLILTGNEIEELPAELGARPLLQKLMLAGNRLRALPAEMVNCNQLELLRIAANQLTEMPAWLPSLPKLTWLAYAGNPFCADLEVPSSATRIAWDTLRPQKKLGEGASGVIYYAEHLQGADNGPVAVKIFKGAMTSDGSPLCEMAACIAAGSHRNLIPILGEVSGHPGGLHGLVMSLIEPEFGNLAGPPSLDSCTRDIYPDDKRFGLKATLAIAHGIASAACQLHERGIMHGDLYGHNILHCGEGRTLLGDFGAASFYAPDAPHAASLQRLEVRAFGCLLEELLERSDAPAGANGVLQQLAALRDACLAAEPASRPLFAALERQLADLRQSPLDNPF
ncbi:protein kinase [Massilia sp. Root418]|uniref:leucine-rich repeat-containing protein kinase family protein n=1 Tax=Massilia sp. Root418 TaxID=1736532 RepID=UPI0006F4715F|nr:leucine-rich repeat-containing protein kinase family protein [Massilia sp. Root418]KQW97192.1 protein kinase [Massilia sp. Root418]